MPDETKADLAQQRTEALKDKQQREEALQDAAAIEAKAKK